MKTTRAAAGFTLMHVLAFIVLLGVFLLLMSRLFIGTMALIRDTRQDHQALMHLDLAVDRLRADVWASRRIEVTGPMDAMLVLADGREVRWQLEDGPVKTVTRRRMVSPARPAIPPPPPEHSFSLEDILNTPSDGMPGPMFPEAPAVPPGFEQPAVPAVPAVFEEYQVAEQGHDRFVRTESKDGVEISRRHWAPDVSQMRFSADLPFLLVELTGGKEGPRGTLRLPSQVLLAEGVRHARK